MRPRNFIKSGAVAAILLAGGCASSNTTGNSPLNLSSQYVGQSGPTTRPDSEARVQCRCGTWSTSKGAPTVCKKIELQREREREAAAAGKTQQNPQNASQPTTLPSLMPQRSI